MIIINNNINQRRGSPATLLLLTSLLSFIILISIPAAVDADPTKKKINRCPLRPSHTNNNIHRPPLILGHRGASFHIPEHTLQSYRLALELGADYIEPDLVATKDNVLIAVHDVDLNVTTNVHTYNNGEFGDRARQSEGNGNKWGYYVNDFTWIEIQQLRVKQRVTSGARYDGYDYLFQIPSFTQIVNLLHDWNTRELPLIGRPSKTGGVTGLYVELKKSYYFQQDGNISLADLFLDELAQHPKASELLFDHVTLCEGLRYDEYRVPPLVLQSFEGDVLEYLRNKFKERWMDFVEEDAILASGVVNVTGEEDDEVDHPWIPPLVLLVSESKCRQESFWFDVESLHISGLGPNKNCLLPSSSAMESNDTVAIARAKHEAREWVAKAHSFRLAVHPYTIKLEKEAGGVPQLFSSAEEELRYYYCELKIDGIFSENIAIAQIVGAEGCDAEESATVVGEPTVCIKEERNLWLFGVAFLAIGAFLASIVSTYVTFYCKKETDTNRPLPLPEVDTSLELVPDEEDEII